MILDWGKKKQQQHHGNHDLSHGKEYHHHHFHHQKSHHDEHMDDDWPDFDDHRWTRDFQARMRRKGLPASSVHHHHHHQKKKPGHVNDHLYDLDAYVPSAASVSSSKVRDGHQHHHEETNQNNYERPRTSPPSDFDYKQFMSPSDDNPVWTQVTQVAKRIRQFVQGDEDEGIDYPVKI